MRSHPPRCTAGSVSRLQLVLQQALPVQGPLWLLPPILQGHRSRELGHSLEPSAHFTNVVSSSMEKVNGDGSGKRSSDEARHLTSFHYHCRALQSRWHTALCWLVWRLGATQRCVQLSIMSKTGSRICFKYTCKMMIIETLTEILNCLASHSLFPIRELLILTVSSASHTGLTL
jgi:hypothetical protein